MSFQNCMTFFGGTQKIKTAMNIFSWPLFYSDVIKIIFLSLFNILLSIQIDVMYYNDV